MPVPSTPTTLLRAVAVLAALGCVALWIAFLGVSPDPPATHPAARGLAGLMVVLWLGAAGVAWGGLYGWAYAAFVVGFVPVGFYLLLTPGPFRWIGGLALVYLAAVVALHAGRTGGEEGDGV